MRRVMSVVVIFAAMVVAMMTTSAAADTVIGLAVIHRHGARAPLPTANVSGICGDLCGQLTATGEAMLFQLGQKLQADYPNLAFQDPASLILRGTEYNPLRIVSQATPVPRTIQSGSAVIRGLMAPLNTTFASGAASNVLPALTTTEMSNAQMLLPSLQVNQLLMRQAGEFRWKDERIKTVFTSLFTAEQLAMFGTVFGLSSVCAQGSDFDVVACVIGAEDIMASNVANGVPVPTDCLNLYPGTALALQFLNFMNEGFYHNASDEFAAQSGTLGYALASNIVQSFSAFTNDTTEANPTILHFSAHDTTVMPLAATIGTFNLTQPLFGAALVLEVIRPANGTGLRVRLRFGQPTQPFGTSHEYTMEGLSLICMNPLTGEQYTTALGQSCPLADWAAFINTRGPRAAAGSCYITHAALKKLKCVPGEHEEEEVNPYCQFYRQQCPMWACLPVGANASTVPTHYLTPDYHCKPLKQ